MANIVMSSEHQTWLPTRTDAKSCFLDESRQLIITIYAAKCFRQMAHKITHILSQSLFPFQMEDEGRQIELGVRTLQCLSDNVKIVLLNYSILDYHLILQTIMDKVINVAKSEMNCIYKLR